MSLKLRISLLLLLFTAAAFTVAGAVHSLQPPWQRAIPEEIYESLSRKAGRAEFYLGGSNGYVAVFQGKKDTMPMSTTAIELQGLRLADRAMLEKGIPVSDNTALLQLLEDLGS
ncbi:MAG: BofC C-terminal domain-containing protein [Oscillospiraceae bacterium]|nr:BofC C-terminal domain-containing protein [Oscillospiraceae bacterium]